MSADNWTTCPRCVNEREVLAEVKRHELSEAYGQVDINTFDSLRAEITAWLTKEPECTLREDYELGIYEGSFSVDYRASCSAEGCGFSYKYRYQTAELDDVDQRLLTLSAHALSLAASLSSSDPSGETP